MLRGHNAILGAWGAGRGHVERHLLLRNGRALALEYTFLACFLDCCVMMGCRRGVVVGARWSGCRAGRTAEAAVGGAQCEGPVGAPEATLERAAGL